MQISLYIDNSFKNQFLIVISSVLFFSSFIYYISPIHGQQTSDIIPNPEQNNGLLTLPDLFSKVDKSVVEVTETDLSSSLVSRLGSGFVFDTDGHIITNYHVVTPINNENRELDITFLDGTKYKAKLIGYDPFTDLAVLKALDVPQKDLVPLNLADSYELRVGETVVAIGNPFGLSGSMTVGIVSGLGRLLPTVEESNSQLSSTVSSFSIPDIIQTDAAINPGNSGGPLLNLQGEVVGVNTAIFSNTGAYSGIGFAVPSNTMEKVVPSLIKEGTYHHPYLGIIGLDVNAQIADIYGLDDSKGFLVTDIAKNSPAEKAGLIKSTLSINSNGKIVNSQGDIILKIDDNEVRQIDDILTYLEREKRVGDLVKLSIYRDKSIIELNVELGPRPGNNVFFEPTSDLTSKNDSIPSSKDYDFYDDCLSIAGKSICDFLFQR